jgi:hypothetical protein
MFQKTIVDKLETKIKDRNKKYNTWKTLLDGLITLFLIQSIFFYKGCF